MKQIQFITHENSRFSYADGAEMALKGGCRWIQLRMKEASDAEFIAVAEKIAPMCREYGATSCKQLQSRWRSPWTKRYARC